MSMDIEMAGTGANAPSPQAGNPFENLQLDEKRELARAINRAERLADAERSSTQLASEAMAIEQSMEARGVKDPAARRVAADAVSMAVSSEHALDREVTDYRQLLGGENRTTIAAGQYVQLLQQARTGDVEALNTAQAARAELTEAELANAQTDQEGRFRILTGNGVRIAKSPSEAVAEYEHACGVFKDVQVVDVDQQNKVVAQANVTGADDRYMAPSLQAAANAEKRIEAALAIPESERVSAPAIAEKNEVQLNGMADEKKILSLQEIEERERKLNPESDATHDAIRARKAAELAAMQREQNEQYPQGFESRYGKDGHRVVDLKNPDRTVMHDKGTRLQAPQEFNAETVQLMVATAEARGWTTINVKGSEEFKKAVWTAAAAKGLDVAGYKANPAEQAWAETQREKNGKNNTVTPNDAVKAFREAGTPSERTAAAEKHPELKKAFTMEAAMSAFSKEKISPKAQEAFMARMRDTIAQDLAQGRQLADIRLAKPMFKDQPYNRDQDRGRDR